MERVVLTSPDEIRAMTEIETNQGLCSTCNNRQSCMYFQARQYQVSHCEMFDAETRPAPMLMVEHRDQSLETFETEGVGVAELKGLCTNCENRIGCTFPKPAGGVWHCQEYQ